MLLDLGSDRLYFWFRDDWEAITDETDVAFLSRLGEDLPERASEIGGAELLRWLEDKLSNTLCLTERRRVQVGDFESCLSDLVDKTARARTA